MAISADQRRDDYRGSSEMPSVTPDVTEPIVPSTTQKEIPNYNDSFVEEHGLHPTHQQLRDLLHFICPGFADGEASNIQHITFTKIADVTGLRKPGRKIVVEQIEIIEQ